MKVISFSKWSKFYVHLENARKFVEKFMEKFWSSGAIFSQLWQECMWAVVNVLKTGPKISDQTKRDHKYLDLLDINRKLA